MLNWQIQQIKLELKYIWKISRNSSDTKFNSIITVGDGKHKGIGEVAPNIRYNETPEIIVSEFQRFIKSDSEKINDLDELSDFLNSLKLPNALRFGIESAYIHFLCNANKTDIYTFLGLQKPVKVFTSFSLPIMEINDVEKFYNENNLQRFSRIKIKVNSENAFDLVKEIARISQQPLLIDGNETWTNPDDLLKFMNTISKFNIALIEQPLPSKMVDEYNYLKTKSPYKIFADESICENADFTELKKQFHGINMKLMKAGGYLTGINLLNEAVKHGMNTMVGCMVETTLGISSAFFLCAGIEFVDLDGFLIIKDEPFKLLKEKDGMLMC